MLNRTLLCACSCVFACSIVLAQEEAVDLDAVGEPWWTIRFEPLVQYASASGEIRLPSSGVQGDQVDLSELNLDSPRLSPMGRFMASRGKWRFSVSGFGLSSSDRGTIAASAGRIGGVSFAVGDRLDADLRFQSLELGASYRLLHHRRAGPEAGSGGIEFGVDVLAGMRFQHVDFDVRVSPVRPFSPGVSGDAGSDQIFAEPILGGRVELDLSRAFGFGVESTVGGFSAGDHSSISFTIDAGFVYRPVPALGVMVGYHMLIFAFSNGSGADEFEWQGSIAGLYWGAQLSF